MWWEGGGLHVSTPLEYVCHNVSGDRCMHGCFHGWIQIDVIQEFGSAVGFHPAFSQHPTELYAWSTHDLDMLIHFHASTLPDVLSGPGSACDDDGGFR